MDQPSLLVLRVTLTLFRRRSRSSSMGPKYPAHSRGKISMTSQSSWISETMLIPEGNLITPYLTGATNTLYVKLFAFPKDASVITWQLLSLLLSIGSLIICVPIASLVFSEFQLSLRPEPLPSSFGSLPRSHLSCRGKSAMIPS